ncbi:Winged helix-turn-helix transcription repressor DNA-binding [Penicillium malachiteum]|uniref:Winged helix-turn-helix transcription repressor DNA-binding n=1 Tax=Penicillium malachiteum TaxID=1324776 RepID=UPI002549BAAB|nr:Winged helix-turn-helix transcription repressor DNA-binding [Penicillium malachiteum]KAJ5715327.1 Winged helix-turn-helix transcription repressor DNA-binding [Penicillium malachiteum]
MLHPHLVASINEAKGILSNPGNATEEELTQLRQACTSLSTVLETPTDRIINGTFQVVDLMIVRMGIQLGVFDVDRPAFGPSDVAAKSGCDPALASRVMRGLVTLGLMDVTKGGLFKQNESAKALKSGAMVSDAVLMTVDITTKWIANTISFFEASGYREPHDGYRGIFQLAAGTSLHFFDWLPSQPHLQDAFNRFMEATASESNPAQWAQWLPIEPKLQELYENSQESQKPLTFVDVGGGHGHEAKAVMKRFPHLPCRFVVQDGPKYVNSHDTDGEAGAKGSLERMEYSFFNEQPVKNAHVYFLGRVLHNWADQQARQILQNIRAAMDRDSVLFIHERVLSDDPAEISAEHVRNDWAMMSLFSAPERSKSEWGALLYSAHLQLVKVWVPTDKQDSSRTSLLEAVAKY